MWVDKEGNEVGEYHGPPAGVTLWDWLDLKLREACIDPPRDADVVFTLPEGFRPA